MKYEAGIYEACMRAFSHGHTATHKKSLNYSGDGPGVAIIGAISLFWSFYLYLKINFGYLCFKYFILVLYYANS